MWSKSLFLALRIKIRSQKHSFRLFIPLAIYPLSGLLLSIEPLVRLIPGRPGDMARIWLDSLHGAVYAVMDSTPQSFVRIDVEEDMEQVLVDVRTWGLQDKEGI